MIKDNSIGSKTFDVVNYTLITLAMIAFILPFWYLFIVSISDAKEVALYNVNLLPKGINFESYKTILSQKILLTSYWNSVRYTVVGTIITLSITILCAFPLSLAGRLKNTKKIIVIFFTITMFFSGGLIPSFLLIKDLNMMNTMWAIVLPTAFSFWYIIITRTNFQTMPKSLYDSAFIDGANDWTILFRIQLPLSKAVIATITLFSAVAYWNSFFPALLYLNKENMQPLSILLRRVLIMNEIMSDQDIIDTVDPLISSGKSRSLRMSTIFVTIGPIVAIYPFIQKYFIKGVMIGSVKG